MPAAVDELERGRHAYATRAWAGAHEALTRAHRRSPLGPADLELLATAAYMLGRDEEYAEHLGRAHEAHAEAGRPLRAARCALWIGMHLVARGDMGRGSGWIGRAQRLVEHEDECVERAYLLLPQAFQREAAGDLDGAVEAATRATEAAGRFGDRDLFGLAAHLQGHFMVRQGRVEEGLALLDESMLAVATGELSPVASGIVYCGVIIGCQEAYELRRAREWTAALTDWCAAQPDMVAFTGRCRLHRAEILQVEGAWGEALDEARSARDRAARAANEAAAAQAVCLQGDVHRLRGELAAAEACYRDAGRGGCEPQPGLALLRLAQGDVGAAVAGIRRALAEAPDHPSRGRLLPAHAEIMLAAGEGTEAAAAAGELERLATLHRTPMLGALAAHAGGAVLLAGGDAAGALGRLRRAARLWREVGAPYEVARARALVGVACRELGDDDAAALELEAAREALAQLGAGPELARIEALAATGAATRTHGLTGRELEVLRLVAAGRTNRAIADELVLSERTVDRHVSNILAKLRVPSRAAATAYAYEHRLV